MVGGICQHFAAAVAVGVADDRLSSEFPDLTAAANLLHTDRVDLTEIKSSIDFIGDVTLDTQSRIRLMVTLPYRRTYLETVY